MEKVKRSSLTVRLPQNLRDWIAQRANENFTSVNDEIIRLIKESQKATAGK
ncbi:Arc family DNA-binding protein [Rhizobium sp. CNPSo 3968]|uniref:Arc family DNA-binding protein n=1 Tax=Rhizobium sp. CNPSo 3968 TaxID=3021408 RepID=UPI0033063DED